MRILQILFCCVLWSCELQVEVDIPGEPSKIVVNSVFTPDSTWFVTVHSSRHILKEISPPLNNLTVTLRDDSGQEIELTERPRTLHGSPDFVARSFISTTNPQAGMSYEINATSDGFSPVSAIASTPSDIEIMHGLLDTANMIRHELYMSVIIPVEFTFQDPAGSGDYYYPQLQVTKEWTETNPETGETSVHEYTEYYYLQTSMSTDDTFDFGGQDDVTLDDALFDGKLHTVRLYTFMSQDYTTDPFVKKLTLHLHHASEEYFKYFKSVRLQGDASGNPFAQPVQVFSNVQGGLGIFAGYTRTSWEFIQ